MKSIDLYRTAWVLLREYGDDAPIIAARRADALLAQGDIEGRAVWLGVIRAINGLRRDRRPGDTVQ